MACVANGISIQAESGNLNDVVKWYQSQVTCLLSSGEIGHFHRCCHKFDTKSQSRDYINTVFGKRTHSLAANSPVTDKVLKSILKELMIIKVVEKNYKQKYQQAKASAVSTIVTPVTTGQTTVTNPTPAITTTTIPTTLKGLRMIPATKSKVALPSSYTGVTGKTTSKPSGLTKNAKCMKKNTVFELLSRTG